MKMRCQHGVEYCDLTYREPQCTLEAGHPGPHRTGHDIEYERELNKHPTLDAIREVVREEMARGFHEFGLQLLSTDKATVGQNTTSRESDDAR